MDSIFDSIIILFTSVSQFIQVYVHRSGRTARGKAEGTTALLVAPEDLQGYRNICKTLNRGIMLFEDNYVCNSYCPLLIVK